MGDVTSLAQALLRLETAGRNEDTARDVIAPILESAGLHVMSVPWQPARSNLIATWNGGGRLVLSGHLDTVPCSETDWKRDPFLGEIDGDRIYGLGASDMKGGVAAITRAAVDAARRGATGFTVVLTSGEETGCEGAAVVARTDLLRPGSVFVIGEATGNSLRYGHKGATWLTLTAHGRAAHASRPELGTNAIEKLSDAIRDLRRLDSTRSAMLGQRTTSVGMVDGGTQPNLVPTCARMTVDVRTVPGSGSDAVREILARYGDIESLIDIDPVWADPGTELSGELREAVALVTGDVQQPGGAAGVSYFTDASRLDATRARSYVLGPGDIDEPHSTDESVSISNLDQAAEIYGAIIDRIV